ncbi:CENP-S/Mhf1 [Trinorchestia longiramus]|nr:CENP-S/Mhf1 [Trinorchestia longiramus]
MSASTKNEKKAVAEAVHYTVGQICQEVGTRLGVRFSTPVMAAVADIATSQIDIYAQDLTAFAKHAKRSMVSTEDVKLLVRRNPSLKIHIEDKAAQWSSDQPEKKEKKKRGSKKRKEALSSSTHEGEDEAFDLTDVDTAAVVDMDSKTVHVTARPSLAGPSGSQKTSLNPDSIKNDLSAKWPNFQLGFDDLEPIE